MGQRQFINTFAYLTNFQTPLQSPYIMVAFIWNFKTIHHLLLIRKISKFQSRQYVLSTFGKSNRTKTRDTKKKQQDSVQRTLDALRQCLCEGTGFLKKVWGQYLLSRLQISAVQSSTQLLMISLNVLHEKLKKYTSKHNS